MVSGVEQSLNALAAAFTDASVRAASSGPVAVQQTLADALLAGVSKAIKSPAPEVVSRLCAVLAQRRRMAAIPSIAQLFESSADEKAGRRRVSLVTAGKTTAATRKTVLAQCAKVFDGTLLDTWSQDQTVIGGFVARSGDVVLDASAQLQLKRLRTAMLA